MLSPSVAETEGETSSLKEIAMDKIEPKKRKLGRTIRNQEPKIGRNQPCRCGSGKKYKVCCHVST